MNQRLAKRLRDSIAEFYEQRGAAFSRTRRGRPWKEEELAAESAAAVPPADQTTDEPHPVDRAPAETNTPSLVQNDTKPELNRDAVAEQANPHPDPLPSERERGLDGQSLLPLLGGEGQDEGAGFRGTIRDRKVVGSLPFLRERIKERGRRLPNSSSAPITSRACPPQYAPAIVPE
jgi:hypothetical protein